MKLRNELTRLLPVLLGTVAWAGAFGVAHAAQRLVPADTVVHARLDKDLTSKSALRGERFMATLAHDDYSGFPEGTRFEGVVTDVQHPAKNRPGVLNVKIERAVLPGGQRVPVSGSLASLDSKDVQRSKDGRLVSREKGKKFDAKWVGYGAAGGAVLSTLFGGKLLNGALIGALGGAAYSYLNKDKDKEKKGHYSEVSLKRGTDFGFRLNSRAAFADGQAYRYAAYEPAEDDRDSRDRDRDNRDRDRDRRERDR